MIKNSLVFLGLFVVSVLVTSSMLAAGYGGFGVIIGNMAVGGIAGVLAHYGGYTI